MADSSALCCSSFRCFGNFNRSKGGKPSKLISFSFFSRISPTNSRNSLLFQCNRSSRDDDSSDWIGDDQFGLYPWDSPIIDGNAAIQWVQSDRVTLFTADGLMQIGGSLVPQRVPHSDKRQGRWKASSQRLQRFQESDYMDPKQGLCLGALFDIAATNGLDMGRRLCIFGFCRSIEMLSDVVEDTVLEHGGEIKCSRKIKCATTLGTATSWRILVHTRSLFGLQCPTASAGIAEKLNHPVFIVVVTAEKGSKEGLQEKLRMTVAVPLLWGVPPASETLHFAVRSGGGIVEKVYWQWDFL